MSLVFLKNESFFSLVVSQTYITEAENEFVIRGNAAVMKCKIPSFVADFVTVDSWIADDGTTYKYPTGNIEIDYGTL